MRECDRAEQQAGCLGSQDRPAEVSAERASLPSPMAHTVTHPVYHQARTRTEAQNQSVLPELSNATPPPKPWGHTEHGEAPIEANVAAQPSSARSLLKTPKWTGDMTLQRTQPVCVCPAKTVTESERTNWEQEDQASRPWDPGMTPVVERVPAPPRPTASSEQRCDQNPGEPAPCGSTAGLPPHFDCSSATMEQEDRCYQEQGLVWTCFHLSYLHRTNHRWWQPSRRLHSG